MRKTGRATGLAVILVLGLIAEGASGAPAPITHRPGGGRPAPSVERRPDRHVESRRAEGRREEWRREEWPDRGRHRHDNTGAFLAAGAIGLLAGAAIASANRYDPPPAPIPYGDVDPYTTPYGGREDGSAWHDYCAGKYSTYDPRDGMYVAVDGRRYPCH